MLAPAPAGSQKQELAAITREDCLLGESRVEGDQMTKDGSLAAGSIYVARMRDIELVPWRARVAYETGLLEAKMEGKGVVCGCDELKRLPGVDTAGRSSRGCR